MSQERAKPGPSRPSKEGSRTHQPHTTYVEAWDGSQADGGETEPRHEHPSSMPAAAVETGSAGASSARRRIGLAALALLGLAAAAAAIIGTHGSSWGKTASSNASSASQAQPAFEVKSVLDELTKAIEPELTFNKEEALNTAGEVGKAYTDTVTSTGDKQFAEVTNAQGQRINGMGVVAQTAGAATQTALAPAYYMQPSGDKCVVSTYDELKEAVEEMTCATVIIQQGVVLIEMEDEIVVRRRVTVLGNPSLMPTLQGEDHPRHFHVMPGGYLDARFIQFVMAEGQWRDAMAWEFATSPQVLEVRGGSVLIEPGALGATFISCFFLDDPDTLVGLESAIEQSLNQYTVRIYGGHIFHAGGDLELIGCMFWDITIMYPFTNFWIIGGDILQLGGTMNLNSVTWLETNGIILENGIGLFVAQFAGVSNIVFNTFVENNMVASNNGMGTFLFMGGGACILTLSTISEFSGVLMVSGLGGIAILGGVFIETGVANTEAFPMGTVFGIGFEYAIGSGAVVTTGSSMNEFNCIYWYAALGEIMFVGSGLVIATGSPFLEYISIVDENMQGGAVFLGAGYGSFVACPFSEWLSIGKVAGAGEYVAVDAGFLVWVASVITEAACIEFARVMGSVLYVGAGALVLVATPLYEAYGPLVTRTSEFYVMGTCEYEGSAISGVSGGGVENSRGLVLEMAELKRDLYTLPRWVAPLQGCQKDVDFFFGNAKQIEGASGGVEEGGRRLLSSLKPHERAIVRAVQAKRGAAAAVATTKALVPSPRLPAGVKRKLFNFHKKGGYVGHLPPQLRRQVTNHWHGAAYERRRQLKRALQGLPEAAAPLGTQFQPETGVLAMGVERNQFERTAAMADKQMPPAWLDGFEATRAELNRLVAKTKAEDGRPAFYIESPVSGYCGLCNVPGVNGTGMGACDVKKDCRELNVPSAAERFTAKGMRPVEEEQAEEEAHFDDHHLLVLNLEATTTDAIKTLDASTVQEAAVAAVAELQGADPDREAVIVNVYQAGPDPYFAEHFPAPKRSLQETETHSRTHQLQVALVATTKPTVELIRKALEGDENAHMGESRLSNSIRTALLAQGTELGYLGLTEEKYLFVPSYDSPEHTQNRRRAQAAFSATLVDPAQPAVPLEHVEFGKTYKLHLENFGAARTLQVDLIKFHDEEDRKANRHLLHALSNVTTDEDGHAEMDVIFTEHVQAGKDYYFSVQDQEEGSAVFGFSPGYRVTDKPVARKLYGVSRII